MTGPSEQGGGIVNMQFGCGPYEQFILRPQGDGTYAIESEAFPGVFLRLSIPRVLGNRLCMVAKDNDKAHDKSSGVMYAVLDKTGGGWKTGHPDRLNTSAAPGIVAVGDRFQLYYRHHNGNAVYTAWSCDGQNWQDKDQNTLHDEMSAYGGVCPILYREKVWLFYPYAGKYYRGNLIHTLDA